MANIGLNNNETSANPGDETMHLVTVETAAVNVFFDGTLNNYFNVTAEEKKTGSASYANALSNIAEMWMSLRRDDSVMAVYIEGVGSTQQQPDNMMGAALATGETGVLDRVHGAFPKLVDMVTEKRDGQGLPAMLDINVFGFSRGAAAARYFVHLTNTEPQRFRLKSGWDKVLIRINFVGLFDTVASYGVAHWNDVSELHLNFGEKYAVKVFHVVAGDEYRENFSLSTIASAVGQQVSNNAGAQAMGYELRIPGAHSDVGGGYNATEREERDWGYDLQDFVYAQGWYKPEDKQGRWGTTHLRQVKGEYAKVGLALMVDKAHEYSTIKFPPDLLDPPTDNDIKALRDTLREFAKDEKNTVWDLNEKMGAEKAQALRRQWLHVSFVMGSVANGPRLNAPDQPSRKYFEG